MISSTGFSLDAAFAYQPAGRLLPDAACDGQDAWCHLSASVARDPLDLESHARRVVLAVHLSLHAQAVTALLDLFLATGNRALGLRQRLLHQAEACLAEEEQSFFQQHLVKGLVRGSELPLGTSAILDLGLMGQTNLVRHERAQPREESLAQMASALVDQGDLAAAQQLLEQGLADHPDDAEAARELLAIYRHSRNADAESTMRQRLQSLHGKLPTSWA